MTIPYGHPLYQFLGTRYESEIVKYISLSSGSGGEVCTMHTGYVQPDPYTDPYAPYTPYTPDQPTGGVQDTSYESTARGVIVTARAMLGTMDPNSPKALAISAAIAQVEAILSGPYDVEVLRSAVSQLTMAMTNPAY